MSLSLRYRHGSIHSFSLSGPVPFTIESAEITKRNPLNKRRNKYIEISHFSGPWPNTANVDFFESDGFLLGSPIGLRVDAIWRLEIEIKR